MVGTNSVEGIVFLNAKTGTIIRNKVKESPGMVTMIHTSKTEKSGVMYSPLGKLIYTNFTNGTTKQIISVESNLSQPTLFNSDLLFAGVKNNYIYVYHSVTCDLLAKIYEPNAKIVTNRNDSNLYYVIKDGRNYSLKMLESEIRMETVIENTEILENSDDLAINKANETTNITQTEKLYFNDNPIIIKNFYTESRPEITSLIKDNQNVLALCENGTIQKMNNNGYTNLLTYEDNFIFYSQNHASNVVLTNISSKTEKVLYKATNPIQTIHQKDNYLLVIEGSSKIVLIDILNNTSSIVYSGIGIQDAILYTPQDIFVAKTAASSPNSALIHVNVDTKETVMVPVEGEVSFSLSQSSNSNVFYGVCLYSGDVSRTDIFAYYPNNKHYTAIFQWGDEDTEAFTTFKNGYLYSNIGKTQVRAVNVSTRKSTVLPRFASLPKKLEANSTLMVVLNEDGSISWYNAKTNSLYANWYVTVEGNWIEY